MYPGLDGPLSNGVFVQQKFKDSIQNSFISTGCAADIDGTHRKYFANSKKGSIPNVPTGTIAKEDFPSEDENHINPVNLNDDESD